MTVIKLLRPDREEPVETDGMAVADASSEGPIPLGPPPELASVKWMAPPAAAGRPRFSEATPPSPPTHRDRPGLIRSECGNGTGRFTFTFHPLTETGENRLHGSLAALSRVVSCSEPAAGEWLDAAVTLKRDAVRLRNSSQARHAAVLLTLADALTFTAPSDPTLDAGASRAPQQALALLTNPFISQEAEENLVIELISLGWNLAPSSNGTPLAG